MSTNLSLVTYVIMSRKVSDSVDTAIVTGEPRSPLYRGNRRKYARSIIGVRLRFIKAPTIGPSLYSCFVQTTATSKEQISVTETHGSSFIYIYRCYSERSSRVLSRHLSVFLDTHTKEQQINDFAEYETLQSIDAWMSTHHKWAYCKPRYNPSTHRC